MGPMRTGGARAPGASVGMGPHGVRAREHLIEIQREHVARLVAEIEAGIGPPPPELVQAQRDYLRQFDEPRGPVTRAQFLHAVARADVLYFGDYHTLRESQKAPLRVLAELLARGRRVLVATEVVHFVHQDYLDAYLAGALPEDEFLHRIEYSQRWGFPWRNFKLQFDFARAHGLEMWALNSEPAAGADSLAQRAAIAALRIVEALRRDPDRAVAVIFGDLHITPGRLPAEVERLTAQSGRRAPARAIIYQNADSLYWELARQGCERSTDIVELRDGSFCLLNSAPLVKYQSYLNWEMNTEELEESVGLDDPTLRSTVLTDQVHELVLTIARFLGFDPGGWHDFSVHTFRDLDFLDDLARSGRYADDELTELRAQIERNDSYFLPRARILYLGNLSIDHAAEEATHYLNTELAGHIERPPSARFDFYYRALKEALGFLGSRLVNPKRPSFERDDFEEILAQLGRRRIFTEDQRHKRAVARDVLWHLDFEIRWLAGQEHGYPRARAIYERPLPVRIGVTHALGYRLGARLHAALCEGHLHPDELCTLFHEPFASEPRPRELYFDWLDYLHQHAPHAH